MEKSQKEFLYELLRTPSPSGAEINIQKKWMEYTKNYADRVETDIGGNAIAILNPKAKFKVLLAGHCDEIGFIVTQIDENGFISFGPVGGISHKVAPGLRVEILGEKESVDGVIGVNAEHHGGLKEKFEYEDLFIDCGFKSKKEAQKYVNVGDFAVYRSEITELKNGLISSKALDDKTGAFIVAEVIRRLKGQKLNVGVYAVSTTSEEIGLCGAYFAAAGIDPDLAIACDVTWATDYPTVNRSKYGDYKVDGGPLLAVGSPVSVKINKMLKKAADRKKIPVQIEVVPRITGTDADRMRFTNTGVPVALVSLPIRYMHSPVETVSLDQIENVIEILTGFIKDLTGRENLKPLE
ncbi:MAG: M20/M25/M40 family metallo-hydrolase [Candidatus Delongbacteria bacterium]